ncbi:MAG: response regulator transcription factor [Alphaproteobacteria bacterium]|nr:response regulator transcription factor [Alphaproteobacteria bacterium]
MKNEVFRVVLADPNSRFVRTFAELIKGVTPAVQVSECLDLDCALLAFSEKPTVDYFMLDISLLGENWKDRLSQIIEKVTPTQVLLTSEKQIPQKILQALKLGIRGYIIKTTPSQTIKSALNLIFSGEIYVPTDVFEENEISDTSLYCLPNGKKLTPRQIEVLQKLGKGKSNKQIAHELSISEATVKLHINALLRQLKTTNRTQIVVKAQSLGFL